MSVALEGRVSTFRVLQSASADRSVISEQLLRVSRFSGMPRKAESLATLVLSRNSSSIGIPIRSWRCYASASLHNVPDNPLQQLIATRSQAVVFAIVATLAGGLREEIQRAFIIHRFGQHLGGEMVGLVLYSLVFGLGHALQGWDAVLTTTFLGLFWGYVYISRRSIVAPVVSHSGFNAAEIFQYFMLAK